MAPFGEVVHHKSVHRASLWNPLTALHRAQIQLPLLTLLEFCSEGLGTPENPDPGTSFEPFETLRRFPIWYNRILQNIDRHLDPKKFIKKRITTFSEVIAADGTWRTSQELLNRNAMKIDEPLLWAIQNCLPEPQDNSPITDQLLLQRILIGDQPISEMRFQDLKKAFVSPVIAPSFLLWTERGFDFDQENWQYLWKVKVPVKWNETYFLILHQALWTGEKAYQKGWAIAVSSMKKSPLASIRAVSPHGDPLLDP